MSRYTAAVKRVTLLVPDHVTIRVGGARGLKARLIAVDAETIAQALSEPRDYHDRVSFPAGTVEVITVEDAGPDDGEATVRDR